MRDLIALLTETSVLDPQSGLRVHGIKLRELLLDRLPRIDPSHEFPSVESLLWFLLTSERYRHMERSAAALFYLFPVSFLGVSL